MAIFTKKCGCCKRECNHNNTKFVGIQYIDKRPVLELYNCTCGSTMAIMIDSVEAAKRDKKAMGF